MSELELEAEQAISYAAPAGMPVQVLSATYGEAVAVPDLVPTIEVAWQRLGRPGVFTAVMAKVGDWHSGMDALLRLRLFELDSIYALEGGWPPPAPLPDELEPLPAGSIGIE